MKKYDNRELQVLTSTWGFNRQITVNGKIPTQTIKFGEEMAELFEAQNEDQALDAIGDMVVVLSMIADLNKTQITKVELTSQIYPATSADHVALVICYGHLCKSVVRQDDNLNNILANFIIVLAALAESRKSTLNECWNLAYNEIKDRTGKLLENGNFVKDEN
jgi:hypothetical protein